MTRKPKTLHFWRGTLPHWQVEDGRYFVTIHIRGAIPYVGRQRIRAIAEQLEKANRSDQDSVLRINRMIFLEMEAWLDRRPRLTRLDDSQVAQMLMEAIANRETRRHWQMFEFVIMPTHLHMFFELAEDQSLKTVLEDFKRWTGHQGAKLVELSANRFWQNEWFDHWSRSETEDEKIANYVRRNPEKAQLVESFLDWPYGSWSVHN